MRDEARGLRTPNSWGATVAPSPYGPHYEESRSAARETLNRTIEYVAIQNVDEYRLERFRDLMEGRWTPESPDNMDAAADLVEHVMEHLVDRRLLPTPVASSDEDLGKEVDLFLTRATSAWFWLTALFRTIGLVRRIKHGVLYGLFVGICSFLAGWFAWRTLHTAPHLLPWQLWGVVVATASGVATILNAILSQARK